MKSRIALLMAAAFTLAACQEKGGNHGNAADMADNAVTDAGNDSMENGAIADNAGIAQSVPAANPDMTGFAHEVDSNGDGKLSRAEWTAQGLPDSSFTMFEKGRGYVTLKDYQSNPAPAGIDIDGDGKLTVAEFREFDRKMSAQMAADGKAPPRP